MAASEKQISSNMVDWRKTARQDVIAEVTKKDNDSTDSETDDKEMENAMVNYCMKTVETYDKLSPFPYSNVKRWSTTEMVDIGCLESKLMLKFSSMFITKPRYSGHFFQVSMVFNISRFRCISKTTLLLWLNLVVKD